MTQAPPKPKETKPEAEKSVMDIVSEHLKAYSDRLAAEKGGKSSEEDKKKRKKQGWSVMTHAKEVFGGRGFCDQATG